MNFFLTLDVIPDFDDKSNRFRKKEKTRVAILFIFLKKFIIYTKIVTKKNTCENQTTKTGIVNKKSSRTK